MNKPEGNFFPTSKPKLKKVTLDIYYVVRADDEEMIRHAKDCLYEDIMSAVKHDELFGLIRVVDAPEAAETDIPEFLLEEEDEDWLAAKWQRGLA